MQITTSARWSVVLGPGLLVAATGIGAGDLVTATLAGSDMGLVVVWAALFGAILKWTLNEGIARWQLATGSTLLEGWNSQFGVWFSRIFFVYFIIWTFAVGGALVNACGIAGTAFFAIGEPATSKVVWGIFHSLVGGVLIWKGGFKRFERVMVVCVGVMVVSVLLTAGVIIWGSLEEVTRGIFLPTIPSTRNDWVWFLGVLGGVGGTVTMLSYGYWIREAGRTDQEGLRTSQIDLAVSYGMTGVFGAAMVIIGGQIGGTGQGAQVAVQLSEQLGTALGSQAKWLFLIGFWGAVFSSLLGVWQSAPYLFADFLHQYQGQGRYRSASDLRSSPSYQWYLLGLSIVPLVLLWTTVRQAQILYVTLGAWFMPLVALSLLMLNNRTALVGKEFRNGFIINTLLVLTLALFAYLAVMGILD